MTPIPDPAEHASSNGATLSTLTAINESASPVLPRRSEKLTQPPERYSPRLFFTDSGEPTTYNEAINTMDAANLKLPMEYEMSSIHENHAWDLVELQDQSLPVFRLKLTTDSSNPKYKLHS